jgi:nicotinate-nucleotide adenylyltransferase
VNKNKRRIALFGGSFNPVHNGHITIAQDVWEHFKLDRLVWIPVANAPLKPNVRLVDAKHRLAMLRKALKGYSHFEVSEIEIERGGVSYTIDTVETLRLLFPKDHLCWIIGEDRLKQLHRWHRAKELCKMVEFIVLKRSDPSKKHDGMKWSNLDKTRMQVLLNKAFKTHGIEPKLHWIPGRLLDISSTEIRERIKKKDPVDFFLPYAVNSYIHKHRLYIH